MTIESILFLGLGRIGLPEALVFANRGFKVYGFDSDQSVIDTIIDRVKPFEEEHIQEYISKNINKSLFLTSSQDEVDELFSEVDAIIFAMGTKPIHPGDKLPDIESYLTQHYHMFQRIFSRPENRKRELVIIIRTTFPLGGTDLLKKHIETEYNLKEGKDFHLAFVPERLVEGHAIEEEETIPKIIGAYTDRGFELIKKIFEKIGGEIIRVKNPISAEFCKLTDNTFRNTMFAYANDLAMHASKYDIDILQVIHAVNNHYGRNKISTPGFVSGYCLGKDPYIFEMDFFPTLGNREFHSLWYYGRRVNDHMIQYAAGRVIEHLDNISESTVAILGLSFKEDVDDFRMADSFLLINTLLEYGVKNIQVYDPNLGINKYTEIPEELCPRITKQTSHLSQDFFKDVDAIIISHPHHAIKSENDAEKLKNLLSMAHKPMYILDPTGAWRSGHDLENVQYEGIGFK